MSRTIKNKKSKKNIRKSLKQKGGSNEENYSNAIEYLNTHNLNNIKNLIINFFKEKSNNFNMDISLNDPFVNYANKNPMAYLDWYKTKNPEMKNINELEKFDTLLDGKSIYETTIAQICRDILLMILTSKKNLNNNKRITVSDLNNQIEEINSEIKYKEKRIQTIPSLIEKFKNYEDTLLLELEQYKTELEKLKNSLNEKQELLDKIRDKKNEEVMKILKNEYSKNVNDDFKGGLLDLLKKIEICILNNYIYNGENGVYDILISFIDLISFDDDDEKKVSIREKFMKLHLDTPFIVFPIYQQINFQNVLLFMSAPIINFRISNRRRKIHNVFDSPYFDYIHDVCYHGNVTHLIQIVLPNEKRNQWFENMSLVISKLFGYFYTEKPSEKIIINDKEKINYNELTDKQKKQVMAFVFFCLLHEDEKHNLFYFLFEELNHPKTVEFKKKERIYNKLKNIISDGIEFNRFNYIFPNVNRLDLDSIISSLKTIIQTINKIQSSISILKEIEKNTKYKIRTGNIEIDKILNNIPNE